MFNVSVRLVSNKMLLMAGLYGVFYLGTIRFLDASKELLKNTFVLVGTALVKTIEPPM